jgi:hypothetical protein
MDLLKKIKTEKEKLRTLSPGDPISALGVPDLEEIHQKIDEHTIRLIRPGAIKRGPDKVFYFPPEALAWAKKKRLDKPQIQHYYHPQLPGWAREHLEEWVQLQRLRKEGRKNLRRTNVAGLETGMHRPRDLSLMIRTLELRGVKEEEDPKSSAMANAPSLNSLTEILEKSQRVVTDEMIENEKQGEITEKKRTRVRKEWGSWNFVIRQLIKEGLLPKIITPQALRKKLNCLYPEVPWNEV